jgi:hypothetical protein
MTVFTVGRQLLLRGISNYIVGPSSSSQWITPSTPLMRHDPDNLVQHILPYLLPYGNGFQHDRVNQLEMLRNCAVWEAYPSYEYLLRHILAKRQECESNDTPLDPASTERGASERRRHIRTSILNCWGKLDEYYKLLDTLPVYMAALVLNPAQKLVSLKGSGLGNAHGLRMPKKTSKNSGKRGGKEGILLLCQTYCPLMKLTAIYSLQRENLTTSISS